MDLETRLKQLIELWPDLTWSDARKLDHDHDVILLDDAYVFRFACEDAEHEPLEREVRFLEKLLETGISVPEYTHIDSNWAVAGYRPIPGASLSYETFVDLTREQKRDIAHEVARVLNEVHEFPLDSTRSIGIPEDDPWYVEVQRFLFFYIRLVKQNSLSEPERAWADKVALEIASTDLTTPIPRCVIHADIEPPHILVDQGRYTGVIDFGDVLIGDPACDFGWLWELGETFIDDVLEVYSHPSEDLKRRGFYYWFGRAARHMQWGVHSRQITPWKRGYQIFPNDVRDSGRENGVWD
jgi:aminoglycoside 2''-phosphotransferase